MHRAARVPLDVHPHHDERGSQPLRVVEHCVGDDADRGQRAARRRS